MTEVPIIFPDQRFNDDDLSYPYDYQFSFDLTDFCQKLDNISVLNSESSDVYGTVTPQQEQLESISSVGSNKITDISDVSIEQISKSSLSNQMTTSKKIKKTHQMQAKKNSKPKKIRKNTNTFKQNFNQEVPAKESYIAFNPDPYVIITVTEKCSIASPKHQSIEDLEELHYIAHKENIKFIEPKLPPCKFILKMPFQKHLLIQKLP